MEIGTPTCLRSKALAGSIPVSPTIQRASGYGKSVQLVGSNPTLLLVRIQSCIPSNKGRITQLDRVAGF